jgi:nucleoside-diphosphate-sugar epimerase
MRILLTGGCGYIGSAVYNYLKPKYKIVDTVDLEWFGVYRSEGNIKMDFADLDENFLNHYDVIFHTASHSSVPLCKDVHGSFDNNVVKLMNFTKKLKRKQKLIYASSSCVYVESGTVPKVESEMSPPSDGLTLSKTTLDNLMPLLDVEYYGLRFGSVNGWSPNMRTDLMINSMTLSALKNKKVNVFNAHAHRPIVSTHDLCRAVDAIINSGDKRGIYNVASFNLNIGDVGRKVADHLNVELVDKGVSQTYDFMISSDKFKNTFNFEFESTVESIVDSITSNPISETWGRRDAIS